MFHFRRFTGTHGKALEPCQDARGRRRRGSLRLEGRGRVQTCPLSRLRRHYATLCERLFDLDGTLTDSKLSISTSIEYMLTNIQSPFLESEGSSSVWRRRLQVRAIL
jgi:hypothetical protein